MKFDQIVKLCKRSKMIIIYNENEDGGQWIGDGRAIYPLYNLPKLTRENIFGIMDIPEDKQDKFNYQEQALPSNYFSFQNSDRAENLLDVGNIAIFTRGILYYPVQTQNGISFINSKNLSPFKDSKNGYQLFERVAPSGQIYIAVKTGFLLAGIVLPCSEILTKKFATDLYDIAVSATCSAKDKNQISIEEDEQ